MQKINMSVGIVCMVNNTALTSLSREAAVGNEHASNLTYEKMTTSSFDMAKRETSPSPTSGEIQCLFKEAKGHKSTLVCILFILFYFFVTSVLHHEFN